MRRIYIVLVSSLLLITSCTKDEPKKRVIPAPNTTIEPGEVIKETDAQHSTNNPETEAVEPDTALTETGEVKLPFAIETYSYEIKGRRDPFIPLVKEEEEGISVERKLNVENLTLLGVLWGPSGKVAVLKDQTGLGHVLRVNDRVAGGKVVSITQNSIVFELKQYGIVTKYEIKKGE